MSLKQLYLTLWIRALSIKPKMNEWFFVFDKSTNYVQNITEVAKATTKNIVQSNVSNEQSDLEFGYIFKIMHHSPAE